MGLLSKLFGSKPVQTKIIHIVEDDVFYGNLLENFLKIHFPDLKGLEVFRNGEACLAALSQNPEIILMDYFLDTESSQAKNGLETIKEIRKQKPNTKIIVLSAQKEIGVIVEAVKTYNCHYVKKDDNAFERVQAYINTLWA